MFHSLHLSKYSKSGLMLLMLLSRFSRVRLCDPIDGSPPGSPVPGIFQTRTLEWVAISFSNAWKWKVKVKSLSHVRILATAWSAAHQAPPSMGFSRQEYWSGVPLPSPWPLWGGALFPHGQSPLPGKSGTQLSSNRVWEVLGRSWTL